MVVKFIYDQLGFVQNLQRNWKMDFLKALYCILKKQSFSLGTISMYLKSRGPILRVTSSETRSVCVKQALNTRRWLVNVLVMWHVSYKITTLLNTYVAPESIWAYLSLSALDLTIEICSKNMKTIIESICMWSS